MKTLKLFALSFLLVGLIVGCKTAAGSDPVIVTAERTAGIALDTFDAFLRLEYDNHDRLLKVNPKIHEAAELIRRSGPNWITTLRTVTKTYKQYRSPDHKLSVITALAVVQSGLSEAQKYVMEIHP